MGDVSDRLWRLWCSGVLRIVYITRAQTTRTSQWVGLFRLNRFRRFKKKIIIFPWHFSESNVFWWHQERGWCCRQYLRCNLRFNRGEPTDRVRVYTMWCRTRPLNDKKLLLLLLVIWLFWRGGWTRAQNGEKKGSAMAGWVLLLFWGVVDDGPAGKSAAAGRDKWLAPVTAPHKNLLYVCKDIK